MKELQNDVQETPKNRADFKEEPYRLGLKLYLFHVNYTVLFR